MSSKIVLDATFPVGTLIERGDPITDTHANGKFKAFLGAPDQEWELVDDGQNVVPIEFLTQLGTSTSFCGRGDMTPATARQDLTDYHLPINGSIVENFTPVLGTKKIKYTFYFAYLDKDANPRASFRLEVKEGNGSYTEVDESHLTSYFGLANINPRFQTQISWTFILDDVDDSTVGTFAAERPILGFRVTGRESSSSNEAAVHESGSYLTTDGSSTNVSRFRAPTVEIVSLGPVTTSKYKRIA
jgi:hypothetical protein